jgi:hypothetical protein
MQSRNTRIPAISEQGEPLRAPPLPPDATPLKRWRFRRNLVIYLAHRHGLSQRLLADVFDLPRSRVWAIVQEFRHYESS